MDLGILAEIDNGAQEVEQALIGLEALKQLNQTLCGELLMVFSCYLNADL